MKKNVLKIIVGSILLLLAFLPFFLFHRGEFLGSEKNGEESVSGPRIFKKVKTWTKGLITFREGELSEGEGEGEGEGENDYDFPDTSLPYNPSPGEESSLTDMAGEQTIQTNWEELTSPEERLAQAKLKAQQNKKLLPTKETEKISLPLPRRWTRVLAKANPHEIKPPDPFKTPQMMVNPKR